MTCRQGSILSIYYALVTRTSLLREIEEGILHDRATIPGTRRRTVGCLTGVVASKPQHSTLFPASPPACMMV